MKKIVLIILLLSTVVRADIKVLGDGEKAIWYNNSQSFSINASSSMSESVAYIWPVADATSGGQALLSDGSGLLSWGVPTTSAAHNILSGTHDATTNAVTRGSLIYGNSTPKWDELVIGANQLVFVSDGTDPSWGTVDISGGTNLAVNTDHLKLTGDTVDLANNQDTSLHSSQGSFLEQIDFTISEAGGTVTGSLEKEGTGDLIMFFSDEYTTLDCTPADTVTLTSLVGTDTAPAAAFVYVLESNKTLTAAASWPSAATEHIRVAAIVLQSAATTGTNGALMNRNWNDMAFGITDPRGHSLHTTERLRFEHALHNTGVVLSITGSGTGTVTLDVTSGTIYQLHLQSFPAIDMAGADDIHLVNLSGSEYSTTSNLVADITTLADGSTPLGNNKYFNIVIWGVQNRSGETSHLMCNLPTGQYTKSADATVDSSKFSVHTIPSAFRGTGFLIAELTFQLTGAGSTWTTVQNKDLLGQTPTLTPGGGTTTSITSFSDSAFEVFDNADDAKRGDFELSGVTTGNTRTLTWPDVNTKMWADDGSVPLTANWDVGAFDIRAATITPDGLTSGRVIFASTNGLLVDDADMTFSTDRLTVTGLTVTGNSVFGLNSSVFQPTTDSTTFFQVLDADGGVPVFNVDTVAEITSAITFNATDEDNILQVDGVTVLKTGTIAANNIFLGGSVFANDDGNTNVGIGFEAGQFNTISGGGKQNVYIGYRSGRGVSAGTPNSGERNVGIGERTLEDNTSGNDNVAIGRTALLQNTSGSKNIAIGSGALQSNSSGLGNFAFGNNAMAAGSSNNSVAIGNDSMRSAAGANTNVAIGRSSLRYNISGDDNTVIGADAGTGNSGASNVNDNTFIGMSSGWRIRTGGNSNIFIGHKSGINQTTNSNLLIIDNQDRGSIATELTDCLIYGVYNATPASQSLRFNVGTTTWHNATHEDSDGGRESIFNFKGQQSGGEETTLVRIEISHDGAVDDEKGKIVLSTNDGNDSDTPTTALTIDSSQGITFAGKLAGAWDMDSKALTNVNIDSGVITGITDLAIADGGTGQGTAQAAIDALSAVSGATNEHVLTKDTASGNAIWKVTTAVGGDEKVGIDAAAAADYIGAASSDGVLRTGAGLIYTDGGNFITLTVGGTPTIDNLFINEQAAADGDVAGDGQIWVKDSAPNELYFTDDAGTDFQLNKIIQIVNTQTGAVATGTTLMPADDTIPQITEGDEYMTLAITPTSATNKLKIDVVIFLSNSQTARLMTTALFQDTTASAIAVGVAYNVPSNTIATPMAFTHYMTTGTTSSTTFKVRAGLEDAGTTTFNGEGGARILGGVLASSITITEIRN